MAEISRATLLIADKRVWRYAEAAAIRHPTTELAIGFADVDNALEGSLENFLRRYALSLRAGTEPDSAYLARVIFNVWNATYFDLIKYDDMTLASHTEEIRKRVVPLCGLLFTDAFNQNPTVNLGSRRMPTADLLIENARLITMTDQPEGAGSIAVCDGNLALGTRDDLAGLAGPDTRRFDAQDCTVMPGMTEAHLHLFPGAFGLRLLHLDGVHGLEALRAKIRPYAVANPDEALLICKAADYNLFGDGVMTTRQMLDEVLPDRPLLLVAGDHHTGWANTIALERAGILQGRALNPGNEIVMGDDGFAAGELRESEAQGPVYALRSSGGRESLGLADALEPENLTPAQRTEDEGVMLEGLKYCASFGFTSLHNMDGNWYQLELLRALETRGDLLCRTEIPFHLTPAKALETLEEASEMHAQYRTDRLRSGRVKMFMDGVIDSGTAVMVEDYADTPGWRRPVAFGRTVCRRVYRCGS